MAASGGMEALHRAALRLEARAKPPPGRSKRLPALVFMTDPGRVPDPEAVARRLPMGSAVVFRAFGAPQATLQGRRLAVIARQRRLVLLVGADPALARAIGAKGVHLPERLSHLAGRIRRARPQWIVMAAAHDSRAVLRALKAGADAVVISPVFDSRSPSAGSPLGLMRFLALTRLAKGRAYALGGVNATTASRLLGSGAMGLAAVESLAGP
jgi:thiamine-phosphate pyrophosphorylase